MNKQGCRVLVVFISLASLSCVWAMPGSQESKARDNTGTIFPQPNRTNAPSLKPDLSVQAVAEWLLAQAPTHQLPSPQALNGARARPEAQVSGSVPDPASRPGAAQIEALEKLRQNAGGNVKIHLRKERGTPLQIAGKALARRFSGVTKDAKEQRERTAREFLRNNRALLRIEDPDAEFALGAMETDDLQRTHLRFTQLYQGLNVWPCELIVHLDSSGDVDLMNGTYIATPKQVPTNPRAQAEAAVQRANQHLFNGARARASQPELVVYGPLDAPARLAWKFDIRKDGPETWRCIIDATDARILALISSLQRGAVTGSGVDGKGVTRSLNLWQQGTSYYLIDTSKPMYDPGSPPSPPNVLPQRGLIVVYDGRNNDPAQSPYYLISSSNTKSGWLAEGVSVAYNLSKGFDYYLAKHNRSSVDGSGETLTAIVRIGTEPDAYWDPNVRQLNFGAEFYKGIDVVCHELTHGVTSSLGQGGILEYQFQSGALNEAFSDIFGEMVEAYASGSTDWTAGTEFPTEYQPWRRSLRQPSLYPANGNWGPNPSKMSEFYSVPVEQDHGGVHANNTIISHAFYLLAEGLSGAIGHTNAEKIFYRAWTTKLQKQSQFIDCRLACVASAEELFGAGSAQVKKTADAFDAVEIFDSPSTPPPPPTAPVQGQDSTLCLRWDPLWNGYYLVRREAAKGDSANGTFINSLEYLSPRRVSISRDGQSALFVTADNDLGSVNTDGTEPELLGSPGTVNSVALSADQQFFAFSLLFSGKGTNIIYLVNNTTSVATPIKLYARDSAGNKLDIVKYADVMEFSTDGKSLLYDAYCETRDSQGLRYGGWGVFVLDIATANILTLAFPDPDVDIGNPSFGRTKPNLMTFEIVNKTTKVSTVAAVDLFTGRTSAIATINVAGGVGIPCYNGDDTAILYSQGDTSVTSYSSLMSQSLAADGTTPNGTPSYLIRDAFAGTAYRRGSFMASNSLPTITLSRPADGQRFTPPAEIVIEASGADADGTLSKVEFYAGSTKLGERSSAPYTFTWSNVPAGQYRILARAIDSLGAAQDSLPALITVASRPRFSNPKRVPPDIFQFSMTGDVGLAYEIQFSTNLASWKPLANFTNTSGTVTIEHSGLGSLPRGFYRAVLK